MIPKYQGKRTILVCRSCGDKVEKFRTERYKITENSRKRHKDILVVEDGKKRSTEEERKYIVDLYGREEYETEE